MSQFIKVAISKIKKVISYRIFRNLSYFTAGEFLSRLISFGTNIYIARVLGPDNFGKIGFAQALISHFTLVVNLGFDIYGAREISKNKTQAKFLLANIILIKLILFIISYLCLSSLTNFLPKDLTAKKVILLYGLMLFVSVITIEWFFQGFENFKVIGLGRILRSSLVAFFIFVFIKSASQLFDVVIFQILGSILGISIFWVLVFRNRYFDLRYTQFHTWKKLLKSAFLLGASFFMIRIYYDLDKIMIGLWYPDKYVGWYSASYKIVTASLILSGVLWNVFLPRISKLKNIKRTLKVYIPTMLFLGVFLLIMLSVNSERIIIFVFGENYLPASKSLFILSFNVFLVYVNVAFVSPIMLWNEKRYFIIISAGGLTNLIFNFLLIPNYHIIGASVATVLAELSVFLVGFPVFLKLVRKFWYEHQES